MEIVTLFFAFMNFGLESFRVRIIDLLTDHIIFYFKSLSNHWKSVGLKVFTLLLIHTIYSFQVKLDT